MARRPEASQVLIFLGFFALASFFLVLAFDIAIALEAARGNQPAWAETNGPISISLRTVAGLLTLGSWAAAIWLWVRLRASGRANILSLFALVACGLFWSCFYLILRARALRRP
jgi:hypothetical protein